jgi:hypothetical protein
MPIADRKKCQTLINVGAESALIIREALTRLKACRTAFQTHNPSTANTVLDGNIAAINNWITEVEGVADDSVAQLLIDAQIPSHRNKALGDF